MHSQYLQENVNLKAHKHIPGHHDQQNSKPGKSRRPTSESSIKPQNLQVQYSPGYTPNWNHINLVTMTSKLHPNKVHKPFYRWYKITKTHQENPFLRKKARRDSPVVSWTEQEILSSAQTEQEPTHWSAPHSQKSLKV